MGIMRSRNELKREIPLARTKDARWLIQLQLKRLDEHCFFCEENFGNDEKPFYWQRTKLLIMHQHCFLHWIPGVMKDVERIENGSHK